MTTHSYAKINIGLSIICKRPDGYHDLETFFQQISLCDEIQFEATTDGQLRIETSDPACPRDSSNLVIRAAALLKPYARINQAGCFVRLNKKIPIGAGLGGGSSNAALTLKTLNHLWHCDLPMAELIQLSASLGSDVTFFLYGGFALGTGRGELLTPLAHAPRYSGVLISPGFAISTKSVYEKLNLTLTITGKMSKFSAFTRAFPTFDQWKALFVNDLESVVFEEHPVLYDLTSRLYSRGAFYAALSGSGSTVFGLFETAEAAAQADRSFQQNYRTFIFSPIFN
jgi:4-diphosphocytidyl-2-C-methyl-D-erythritol kinase